MKSTTLLPALFAGALASPLDLSSVPRGLVLNAPFNIFAESADGSFDGRRLATAFNTIEDNQELAMVFNGFDDSIDAIEAHLQGDNLIITKPADPSTQAVGVRLSFDGEEVTNVVGPMISAGHASNNWELRKEDAAGNTYISYTRPDGKLGNWLSCKRRVLTTAGMLNLDQLYLDFTDGADIGIADCKDIRIKAVFI